MRSTGALAPAESTPTSRYPSSPLPVVRGELELIMKSPSWNLLSADVVVAADGLVAYAMSGLKIQAIG